MAVFVTCKRNEKVLLKNEGTGVITTFLPLLSLWEFFRCSRAASSAVPCPILRNFKITQNFIVALATCKNEEDPIKNEGARVVTTLYIDFSHTQGHLTL